MTPLVLALLLAPPFDGFESESNDPFWPLPLLSTAQDVPFPDQDPPDPFPKPRLEESVRVPEGLPTAVISIDAREWWVTPDAWLFITRASQGGSATRAHNERQVDFEPEPTVILGATLRLFEPHGLRVEFVRLDEKGQNTVQSDFIYHGNLYPAGREVETRVDLLLVDLDYLYTWRLAEGLTLTAHAGAEYWSFDGRVRTVDGGPLIDQTRAFSSAFPKGGVDCAYELAGGLAVRGSILGGLTTSKRHFYDLQGAFEWRLTQNVLLTLGYRVHDVRFHQSTNEADLFYYGPTAGLELRF